MVAVGVKQTQFKRDVSFAEVEAVESGFKVAKEEAVSSLIMETNCLDVAEVINNTKGSRTEIFWIISEIQKLKRIFQKL